MATEGQVMLISLGLAVARGDHGRETARRPDGGVFGVRTADGLPRNDGTTKTLICKVKIKSRFLLSNYICAMRACPGLGSSDEPGNSERRNECHDAHSQREPTPLGIRGNITEETILIERQPQVLTAARIRAYPAALAVLTNEHSLRGIRPKPSCTDLRWRLSRDDRPL